ncbi:MAG: hypothetical protein ABIX01_19840 [Chitinophagaceae bacterium]
MYSYFKIGLCGIGLDTYWPQFAGLEEKLPSYLKIAEDKILPFIRKL